MGFLRRLFGAKKASDGSDSKSKTDNKKRRWSFGKQKSNSNKSLQPPPSALTPFQPSNSLDANKHAIAVAAATAAVAEAALAAAHAAAEVVRLTSGGATGSSSTTRGSRTTVHVGQSPLPEETAAVKIQSAFRSYLARRALRALKALVKLQALVRGHIVRKQTADMLRRMQTLVRLQTQARASRVHLSSDNNIVHSFNSSSLSHYPTMASKKQAADRGKRQKTVASSSRGTQRTNTDRFLGRAQQERYQALEERQIWKERVFNISPNGKYRRFCDIINERQWGKLIAPPNRVNPSVVREFYANAIPVNNEPFSFTTMVRGHEIHFDRDAINDYLGNPYHLPYDDALCAFQQLRNQGNWDIPAMVSALLRPQGDFEYSAAGLPLRVLRDEMSTFTQLLFLLVLHNIQPNTHTSDATTNVMGLVHCIHEGLDIDLAAIISSWMKEIVLSGHPNKSLKSAKVKAKSPLGFPCLIMGLCLFNRIDVPLAEGEPASVVNDEYLDRHCKPKRRTATRQQTVEEAPPQPAAPAIDPTLQNWFYHTWAQNASNHRAMTAMQESFYNLHVQGPIMTPQEFQAYTNWPGDMPTFGEGASTAAAGDGGDEDDTLSGDGDGDEDEGANV